MILGFFKGDPVPDSNDLFLEVIPFQAAGEKVFFSFLTELGKGLVCVLMPSGVRL